jgi:hypothetical protein
LAYNEDDGSENMESTGERSGKCHFGVLEKYCNYIQLIKNMMAELFWLESIKNISQVTRGFSIFLKL